MTRAPADWHPDPWQPGTPGALRYWDGNTWTGYTALQPPVAYVPPPKPAPFTPDGRPLATWWERVAAQVIDGVITDVLVLALWVPVVAMNWGQVRDWFDAVEALDPETDDSLPRLPDFINPGAGLFWLLVALTLLIGAAYVIVFWRWKQATPGKLIMGLRIRRREAPGDFPWSLIWLRYGFTFALNLVGVVALLDVLWPLWDDRRQALHDKVAGTNVVSVRRDAAGETATEAGPAPRS